MVDDVKASDTSASVVRVCGILASTVLRPSPPRTHKAGEPAQNPGGLPVRRTAHLLVLLAVLAVSGCSGPAPAQHEAGAVPTASGRAQPEAPITVLAAASLTEVFEVLGAAFEEAHPGSSVTFSFGASSALATQIAEGAPADVFASASDTTMESVVAVGAVLEPVSFATNSMEVVVPADNPAGIVELSDLARPGVRVALCQADVPCGETAGRVLSLAGLTVTPVTLEADVKATLTKVELGEVDAALVYRTDALAAGDAVVAIPVLDEVNASTSYPIAVVAESTHRVAAQAFVDFVLSDTGMRALVDAGFGRP